MSNIEKTKNSRGAKERSKFDSASAERLLDDRQVATLLSVSRFWCQQARLAQMGPPFVRLGRLIRYRVSDLYDWLGSLETNNKRNGRNDANGT